MRPYMIALYIRLSMEDEKYDSLSIENQRLILNEYARSLPEGEGAKIQEFVDNGYTGTNFERPAAQQLLELVRQDQIDCIIVKDFSRFGRNSLEVGYFIERVFPLFHTRFISVSDNYDSIRFKGDTGGMDVAFKYLINEYYSRDMSIKTRSAKYVKMERGEYQSKICPYGYRKGDDGRLEPDPETADHVKLIFALAASGISAKGIASELCRRRIMTPGEYKVKQGIRNFDISRTHGVWCISSVLHILDDERYTGTYVMGKRSVIEVGSSKVRMKDRDQWYIIPNHHTPLVSKEIFEAAAKYSRKYRSVKAAGNAEALKGKVFCDCCKHPLQLIGKKSFICNFSSVDETMACHKLKVSAALIEDTVFQSIKRTGNLLTSQPEQLSGPAHEGQAFSEYEMKIEQLKDEKMHLYEQYLSGEITLDAYRTEKEQVNDALIRAKNAFEAAKVMAKKQEIVLQQHSRKETIVDEINAADSLTSELVDKMIEKIFVAPGDQIQIVFKMDDIFAGIAQS